MKKTTKPTPVAKTGKVTALKPTSAPAKKSAPVKKSPAATAAPSATYISAKVDIGFGNHLYLRGEGAGLSWDKGTLMECSSNVLWTALLKGANAPVMFKFLVNDLSWSTGNDYVVEPGQSITITPTF